MEGCGVRSAECLVCVYLSINLMGVNRPKCMQRVCGVHSGQNGTRCRDGVKVMWCHPHVVWLV